MKIEVEKRGLFTKKEYTKLLKYMQKNAKFSDFKRRFQTVYLKRKNFIADPKNPVDLRVRITNGKSRIVLKYGNWHNGVSRDEYEVDFPIHQVDEVFKVLFILGKRWGTSVYSETNVFSYKGVEVALVHTFEDIYHWEFEVLVDRISEVKRAKASVDKTIEEFALKPLDSKGMQQYVKDLNMRKFWQFNFEEQDVDQWIKDHGKYIKRACKVKKTV